MYIVTIFNMRSFKRFLVIDIRLKAKNISVQPLYCYFTICQKKKFNRHLHAFKFLLPLIIAGP